MPRPARPRQAPRRAADAAHKRGPCLPGPRPAGQTVAGVPACAGSPPAFHLVSFWGCFLWFCLLLPRVSLLLGLGRCSGSGVSRPLLLGASFRVVSVSLLSVFLLLGLAVPCLHLRLKLARLFLPLAAFLRSPAPLRPLSVPVPVCGLSGCLCPLGLVFPAFGPLVLACASLALGGVPCSRGWPFRPAFFLGKKNPCPVISKPNRSFCQHQRC